MMRLMQALVVILIALVMNGNNVRSVTITWTNTSGGNWSVTNNWLGVPL